MQCSTITGSLFAMGDGRYFRLLWKILWLCFDVLLHSRKGSELRVIMSRKNHHATVYDVILHGIVSKQKLFY